MIGIIAGLWLSQPLFPHLHWSHRDDANEQTPRILNAFKADATAKPSPYGTEGDIRAAQPVPRRVVRWGQCGLDAQWPSPC